MTKEEKALMLERLADVCGGPEAVFLDRQDRTLLRECAALMREQKQSSEGWRGLLHVDYKGRSLHATSGTVCDWFVYDYDSTRVVRLAQGTAPTLAAAQAAAMAWVDEQEGK